MEQLEFQFGASSQSGVIEFLDSQKYLQHPIQSEYPSVFMDPNPGNSVWVEVQGRVVSHVAFVVRQFQHPLFHFPVGLIGSVATHPDFRGRGLATALLHQAVERLRNRGCLLALLWSENHSFYSPAGFFPAGLETEYWFDGDCGAPPPGTRLEEGIGEVAELMRLYRRHDVKLERTAEALAPLLGIPNLKCFRLLREGEVLAYAFLNKGTDLHGVIHEWAGQHTDLLSLVQFLKRGAYKSETLRLLSPGHYKLDMFKQVASAETHSYLGLMALLDRPALRSLYLSYLRNLSLRAEWGERLIIEGASQSTTTDEEVLKVVFGPSVEHANEKLPFFIWGLDSI